MNGLEQLVENFVLSLPCRDQSPFPEPEVSAPNKAYAQMLLDAFADGSSAELTAITQYIHHHLTIKDDPYAAELELCISLVEMQHLEVIGVLIEKLGGELRYWRANRGYWQGSEVGYGETTAQKLRLDVFSEEAAIAAYQMLIQEIQDPKIQAVLMRIVRDEQVHLRLFMEALSRYS